MKMETYEHFMHFSYEYEIEVPTKRGDKKIATIRVIKKPDNPVKEEVSFKLRRLAKIEGWPEKERKITLSKKDKETLDSKFNEVFAKLNFD